MNVGDWAIHYRYDFYDESNNAFGMYDCGRLTIYTGPACFRGPIVTFLCLKHYGGEITPKNAEFPSSHQKHGFEGRLWKDKDGVFYTWEELIEKYPTVNCGGMTQLSRGIYNQIIKAGPIVVSGWDLGDNKTPSTQE